MVSLQDLKQINRFEWEIPRSHRPDMRVPVRIFATHQILEQIQNDRSLEQATNAATLPGLVDRVVVMPDVHQGYGFPIGGVAATKLPHGIISPGAIGYDINCGVRLLASQIELSEVKKHLSHLADTINRLCPSGVGKTLLAQALAEFLFSDKNSLIQLDMSEFMEKHNVSRLVGAPPGYVGYEEGGQLTERIRRRPYSVLLLDEIEKAHPDVYNILLQIMDEGRLTDSFGRSIDFKNVILIMTSNLGADLIRNQSGFGFGKKSPEANYEKMKDVLQKEVEHHFRPEFLNRLDDTIVFKALTRENLQIIVDYELAKVFKRLIDHGLKLELTDQAKEFLIDKGYDPEFGARPLRRAIEHYIEDPISESVLAGKFKGKNLIKIDVQDEEHLKFEGFEVKEPKESEPAVAKSK